MKMVLFISFYIFHSLKKLILVISRIKSIEYGSGHERGPALLPGFAIIW